MKKKGKGVKAFDAGYRMKKQRAVGPLKSEPDQAILPKQNQVLGGVKKPNPGAAASSKAARNKRLSGVRI